MTPALIMLVVLGLPSYNGVEVYYLKGVIWLPIVISFRDRWYTHIFFLEMGSLMTSSSSAGPIQISKFPEPWFRYMGKISPAPWRPCFLTNPNGLNNLGRGSPKEHFCKIILKSVQWFLTRRFFKFLVTDRRRRRRTVSDHNTSPWA